MKQRIELFSEDYEDKEITLIHDNAPQFTSIDYSWCDIEGVNICPYAPNMNAYVERMNGSIRREALDHFLLFSDKQIRKIIKSYVDYYNHHHPHQGIERIPDPHQIFGFGWFTSFILPEQCLRVNKTIPRDPELSVSPYVIHIVLYIAA